MNDTPQGDGNATNSVAIIFFIHSIRMNDTPQGDGNLEYLHLVIQKNHHYHKNE